MTITLDLGHALASPSFHPRQTKLSPSKKRRLERRAEARAKAAEKRGIDENLIHLEKFQQEGRFLCISGHKNMMIFPSYSIFYV